jgi:hypothetical protein
VMFKGSDDSRISLGRRGSARGKEALACTGESLGAMAALLAKLHATLSCVHWG